MSVLDQFKKVGETYGNSYLRTALMAGTQAEAAKHYRKQKPTDDNAFVAWYVGQVWEVPRMVQYIQNIGCTKADVEQACWQGVYQAKEQLANAPEPQIKIGRNEPCLCGSGKKYKKCCGR